MVWRKTIVPICIVFSIVLSSIALNTDNDFGVKNVNASSSSGNTLYVGGSGSGSYVTIQSAIDAANTGDTVFVYSSTYYEDVVINKSINLYGEDRDSTIIKGLIEYYAVSITSPCVALSGFTICGINLDRYSSNNTITGNTITNNRGHGIILQRDSSNNTITGNTITNNNNYGIYLGRYSRNNVITGNTITQNYDYGIFLYWSSNNVITGNTITQNVGITKNDDYGIHFEWYSSNNTITGNTITDNANGIHIIKYSSNNVITENILTNNGHTIFLDDYSSNNILTGNTIINNRGHGIIIESFSSNNTITGNTITNNSADGITFSYSNSKICNNNTITGNIITNNDEGIDLGRSSNNVITGNIITNNDEGINLGSSNNTIKDNIIINNTGGGIRFYDPSTAGLRVCCFNNTIIGNIITNNTEYGISLIMSDNNTIVGNTITFNNYGIDIYISNKNTIAGNTITNNNNYGISFKACITLYHGFNINYIRGCNSNRIYHNNFINNSIHANISGGMNTWDNGYPSGGNYWDNYTGIDANGDNIGDVPYFIPGGDNLDRYPLMNPYNLTMNQPPTCSLSSSPNSGIVPLTVTFTLSASDPDGTIDTWVLDINNDGTPDYSGSGTPPSTQQHTYQTAGTYTAKFTVTDNQGATASYARTITVSESSSENQLPTCILAANPTNGFAPLTVTFTLTASDPDGSISTWSLDINNDGTSDYVGSGTPPATKQHIYQTNGTYIVNLTVTDNQGAVSSDTTIITVNQSLQENQPPTCMISANITSGFVPLRVLFTLSGNDSDGMITSFTADFNSDGAVDYFGPWTPLSPLTREYIYYTVGEYEANLTVTDNEGATAYATETITVLPDKTHPESRFNVSIDGLIVTFNDTSIDLDGYIIDWYWGFGDGTFSTSSNPIHTYDDEGSYTVTLTVTDNEGNTDDYSKLITVTGEEDGGDDGGIPGFEFIPLMFSFLCLLVLARRKRKQ